MARKINFRSFFYAMIMLMAAILCFFLALKIEWLGIICIILLLVVPLVIAVVCRKKLRTHVIVTIVMTTCLTCIAMAVFFVSENNWLKGFEDGYYYIEGTIDSNYMADEMRFATLDDLKFNGKKVKGRLKILVEDDDRYFHEVEVGYRVECFVPVYVESIELVGSFVNASAYRTDIRYEATVDGSKLIFSQGKLSVIESINKFIRRRIGENVRGYENGAIAYAILTGDKDGISDSVREVFAASGIAHILAVSGLHIGFFMAMVTFVLRKLKVGKRTTFGIDAALLLFYIALTGFAASATRAAIMYLVGFGGLLLTERSDTLNSLGLAATVILTVSPFMLFDVGFIMSISAVFGMIVFIRPITKGLERIKLPTKVASAMSVTIAAQLGILPAQIAYFGTLQLYSIIINMLFIPVMSVVYIFLFLSTLLSVVPFLGFFLTGAGYCIEGMTIAAAFCASLPLAVVPITSTKSALLMLPTYFLISDYVNLKHKRLITILSLILLAAFILTLTLVEVL